MDGGLPPNTWAFKQQTSSNKQATIETFFIKGKDTEEKIFMDLLSSMRTFNTRQNINYETCRTAACDLF
jgi:hypothetical protein